MSTKFVFLSLRNIGWFKTPLLINLVLNNGILSVDRKYDWNMNISSILISTIAHVPINNWLMIQTIRSYVLRVTVLVSDHKFYLAPV